MDDTNFPASPPAAPGPNDIGLRELDERAAKIFMNLVAGLSVGDAKKLDNEHGTFMAVSIDFLMGAGGGRSWALYAIAHRYLANGDLIPDPDVEFYVVDDPTQPGVDDPHHRLDDFHYLSGDGGPFETIEVPGFPGRYALVVAPAVR
jgi:hypothetical protein